MADTPADIADLADLASNLGLEDHIRERVKELIDFTFDTALDALEHGDQQSRTAVMKALLPIFIRVQRESEQGDASKDIIEAREETQRLIAGMGRALQDRAANG